MKIIEQNACFPRWCDSHKIEMDEARAFIDSKAHMAELEINPGFSISRQRINYQRAFYYTLMSSGDNYRDYKVSMRKGKIIVAWLKYK